MISYPYMKEVFVAAGIMSNFGGVRAFSHAHTHPVGIILTIAGTSWMCYDSLLNCWPAVHLAS